MKKLICTFIFYTWGCICQDDVKFGDLAFFLDASEQIITNPYETSNFGSLSYNLLLALEQKIPIVTTAALFNNLLVARQFFDDCVQLPIQSIITKYKLDKIEEHKDQKLIDLKTNITNFNSKLTCMLNAIEMASDVFNATKSINTLCSEKINIDQLSNVFCIAKLFHYNYDEWIHKKINSKTYILIPKNYYQNTIPELKTYKPTISLSKEIPFTPLELKLGIALEHMENITEAELLQPNINEIQWELSFYLESIFIPKKAYAQKSIKPLHWNLYFLGHGSQPTFTDYTFAGLQNNNIHKWLIFCSQSIITNIIVFDSCYLGGRPSARLTTQFKGPITEGIFPFTLIFIGINDAPTYSLQPSIPTPPSVTSNEINLTEKRLLLSTATKFQSFFDECKKIKPDYSALVKSITPLSNRNNIAQLKLAHLEWTIPLDIFNKSVAIYPTLALGREHELNAFNLYHKQPNTKLQYWWDKPTTILLYTPLLPFSLKIPSDFHNFNLTIISAIPGDIHHELTKINAPTFTLSEIIKAFFKIEKTNAQKTFLIKEIISKDYPDGVFDTYILINKYFQNKDQNMIYTTINGNFYENKDLNKTIFLDLKKIEYDYKPIIAQAIDTREHWHITKHVQHLQESISAIKNKPHEIPEKVKASHYLYENKAFIELSFSLGFITSILKGKS